MFSLSVVLFVILEFVFDRYVSDMIFFHLSIRVDMSHNEASLSDVTVFVESESNPNEAERHVKNY